MKKTLCAVFLLWSVSVSGLENVAEVLIPQGYYTPLFRKENAGGQLSPPIVVESFRMDIHAVTNEEFRVFVIANPSWQKGNPPSLFADASYLRRWTGPDQFSLDESRSPVTNVSWFAARAYCAWKNKRLPDLAEWERAAAAGQFGPNGETEAGFYERILGWYNHPVPDIIPPVMSTPRNFYGLYDMHGLVWEWTEDFNSAMVTGESRGDSAVEREMFCGGTAASSSDFRNYASFMRFAFRSSLEAKYSAANLSFRCARDAGGRP